MELIALIERYLAQKGSKEEPLAAEIIEAVATALQPMLELPASPENMWQSKKLATQAEIDVRSEHSTTVLQRMLMGAINGGYKAIADHNKEDTLSLQQDPFYFKELNKINNSEAVAAVDRGNATIGELFSLQPSIFCS